MSWSWNDGTGTLIHHGIKGQKWGIRRYQNPDGTLTAEGKRRQKIGAGLTTIVSGVTGARVGKKVAKDIALNSNINRLKLKRAMGVNLSDYYYYRGANPVWKDIKSNLHLTNPALFDKRYEGFTKGTMFPLSNAGINLMSSTTKELGRILTASGITGTAIGALTATSVALGSIYVAKKIKEKRSKE